MVNIVESIDGNITTDLIKIIPQTTSLSQKEGKEDLKNCNKSDSIIGKSVHLLQVLSRNYTRIEV